MSFLILVRHGQSVWNLEKRFTGWVDVDLTAQGKAEAEKAGVLIKERNIEIDFYYSSLQLRANNTLKIIQKILNDEKPKPLSKPPVDIRELDPDTNPKSSKKRHSVKLGRSGLNFDVELDTRRSPRNVKALPLQSEPDLEEIEEQTPKELASLQQGSDKGKALKADVDNLDPPDLVDAPEKIVFFQSMLRKLEEEHGWQIESKIGDVPKKRCRSQHLVGDRPRRYCHAVIKRDKSTTIQILEIELTSKLKKGGTLEAESLSTLFFRAGDTAVTFQRILN